jgi:hypothetical protein
MKLRQLRPPTWSLRLLWKLVGTFLLSIMLLGAVYVPLDLEVVYQDFQSVLNARLIY